MRILFLVTRAGPVGGAQVHVRDLASSLRDRGHEVIVLAGGSGALFDDLNRLGIRSHRLLFLESALGLRREWRGLREIGGWLRQLQPDLLSTHSSKAGILGRLAARSQGCAKVHTAHGWAFASNRSWVERTCFRLVERLVAPLGDAIITVSDFDLEQARVAGIRPRRALCTVHNGVGDVASELLAEPRSQPVRIVLVARWSAQKDHRTFLESLKLLRSRCWTAEVIGGGTADGTLEAWARELGLGERVIFRGECLDVAQRLARAQVFVLSTHFEGLPRSVLEAMRAGLPVVATDVGGVREEVLDGITGRLVPPRRPDLMARVLDQLVQAPELRSSMGRAGRQRFESAFRLERMVTATEALYERLLPSGVARGVTRAQRIS